MRLASSPTGRMLLARLMALVVAVGGGGLLVAPGAGAQGRAEIEPLTESGADGTDGRGSRSGRPDNPGRPDNAGKPEMPGRPGAPVNGLTCGTAITEPGVYDVTSNLDCDAELATVRSTEWQPDELPVIEIRLNGFTVTGPAGATAVDVSILDGPSLSIDGGEGTITGYQKVIEPSWPPYEASVSNLNATAAVEGRNLTLVNVHVDMLGADVCGVSSSSSLVMSDSSVTGSSRAGVCAADATLERVELTGNHVGIRVVGGEVSGRLHMIDSRVADNDTFGALVSAQDSLVQGSSFTDNGASGLALEVGTWADPECGSCPGDFNPTNVVIVDSVFAGNGYSPADFGRFAEIVGDDGITMVNPWRPGLIGPTDQERLPATLTVDLTTVTLIDNADAGADITGNDLIITSSGITASGNGGADQCIGVVC